MSKVLLEYFNEVYSFDIECYGYGRKIDFLDYSKKIKNYDWIITNPPFKHAEEFVKRALGLARVGVAILARTVFLESVGRYNRLFRDSPPNIFAQFVERVPMVKGRLDRTATTATGYCWLVWARSEFDGTRVVWIPPCRKSLERDGDYE
jgi:hypothetical protein